VSAFLISANFFAIVGFFLVNFLTVRSSALLFAVGLVLISGYEGLNPTDA